MNKGIYNMLGLDIILYIYIYIYILFIPASNTWGLTMAEGVVSSGAIPGRHGEHIILGGPQIADAAVLRVVDKQSNDVGAVLCT